MGEVITNLKARFTAESTNVARGLKPGEDALTSMDKAVGKNLLGLKNLIPQMTALGLAAGAFEVLKESIESIEGPGDRLDEIMGGLKESIFEVGKAIATLDFSNFFGNITEGYKAGKEFAAMLDELADRSAYNDYRISQLRRESAALQEIVKDKTLELSVRADAAEKVREIEEKIKKRREDLAKEEFNISKAQWTERNKMESQYALELYEIIDNYSQEVKDKLADSYEQVKAGYKGNVTDDVFVRSMMLRNEYTKTANENYLKYMQLMAKGESDVLVKLFTTYKDIEETSAKAQEEYNSIVSGTTKLLAQEEKQAEKTNEELMGLAKTLHLDMPSGPLMWLDYYKQQAANTPGVLQGSNNLAITDPAEFRRRVDAAIAAGTELEESMMNMTSSIENAFASFSQGFGQWVGELAAGTANVEDLSQLIGSVLGSMLTQLGQVCIETGVGLLAIEEAFASGNGYAAIAAGVALVALGSMISSSINSIGQSTFSGSGSGGHMYDVTNSSGPSFYKSAGMNFTGEIALTAKGSDLVAVINKENLRVSKTT